MAVMFEGTRTREEGRRAIGPRFPILGPGPDLFQVTDLHNSSQIIPAL